MTEFRNASTTVISPKNRSMYTRPFPSLRMGSWKEWNVSSNLYMYICLHHMIVTWPVPIHCRCMMMDSRCTWWWSWWRAGNFSTEYSTKNSSPRGRQLMCSLSWWVFNATVSQVRPRFLYNYAWSWECCNVIVVYAVCWKSLQFKALSTILWL